MNYLKPVGKSIQSGMLALLAMLWLASCGVWAENNASAKSGSASASAVVAATPSSNSEIRQWYSDQVASIPAEDQKWQQQGLTPEQRARRAWEIRHAPPESAGIHVKQGGSELAAGARSRKNLLRYDFIAL